MGKGAPCTGCPATPPAWPASWPAPHGLRPGHHGRPVGRPARPLARHSPGLTGWPFSPSKRISAVFPLFSSSQTRVNQPWEASQALPPPILLKISHSLHYPLTKFKPPRPNLPLHPSGFLHWCGDLEISQVLGGVESSLSLLLPRITLGKNGIRFGYSCVFSLILSRSYTS